MNWNQGIRQAHRWMSALFTLAVIIVIGVGLGQEQPAEWIFYLPLPPLFLLMFTGIYLYVLPFAGKRRRGQTPS
jgi:hypothetical protein